jgi:ABC-type lipoprotein export system ATPase subunit
VTAGLACRAVTVRRRDAGGQLRTVLDALDATFPAGTLTLIGGPTGAGKSTLLHLLAGLARPDEGTVLADGEPCSRWTAAHRDLWRRNAGLVFQSAQLMGGLTVLENTLLPLVPRGLGRAELRARATAELERAGVAHLAARDPAELSGGEQQRVSLARALVGAPRFLLADEPVAHQDDGGLAIVARLLEDAASRGATVVVVSHDPRLARSGLARAQLVLDSGQLRDAR